MHLLAATPGQVSDGTEAVDLGQSPGDIVVLSAASSDLAILAAAQRKRDENGPTLRLASLLQLGHNMSVDFYLENTVAESRLVIVRLLGGAGYWSYGVEQLAALCRARGIALALLPGDDQPDPALAEQSTLPVQACHRLWQYFVYGGPANAENLLAYAASLLGADEPWREPAPLVRAGLYWPGKAVPMLDDIRAAWIRRAPVTPIVFYRALVQADDLAPIDALVDSLAAHGLNPLPVYVASLKDDFSAGVLGALLADAPPTVILNATGFAVSTPGRPGSATPFDAADCPVLQIVLSGGDRESWEAGARGLSPRDLAMNVALPEVDGRIITRAVSFKDASVFDAATEVAVVRHRPVADRIDFVATLAARWARLRTTPAAERRIAVVLANYPNRDGRLGNGVGLDTPAGVIAALRRLREDGYTLGDGTPDDADALMALLMSGPTNAAGDRTGGETLALSDYGQFFAGLPPRVRDAVNARWGEPETDPFVRDGRFVLPAHRFGNVAVGIQPARGYNVDPTASYHDPDLVPPHGYLAFYAWLRGAFDVHAVVHFGKHGNLEWLPGKALALSAACYPEAALGPLPHLYPFIVNDPGEGTQAKRRAAAAIVDHLTPPLTRAESYGPLRDLERLVDEYYQAAGMDARRLPPLAKEILSLSAAIGLDADLGIARGEDDAAALSKIDNYLCELKEMQIRDGLHVFGRAPAGRQLTDLLVALTRLPRHDGKEGNASLVRALAGDLGLAGFDPLECELGAAWTGARPDALAECADDDWRSNGDTVERLELIAAALVAGERAADPGWTRTLAVLDQITSTLRPAVEFCGAAELDGLARGMAGRFVAPGASGAPTRGRPDVLPTGRNFYSVDSRAVPSPTAWTLGWKSAALLIERHFQDHGAWPRRIAMSAWGTANMRTGGDDIAQALALMGVQPGWDRNTGRVTGFEIMPQSVLGRPRVDVVFRVSGFFRDAFPFQMDLLDSAARAVAALDEDEAANPLAAATRRDAAALRRGGLEASEATRRAASRVFGSKPGAYGAGLQALIDERCWQDDADLAEAYLAWGGYAYGGGVEGAPARDLFAARLKDAEIVVQNQDNREHDLLDSDDYYQFEGGLAAAVRHLSGAQPVAYHNDHSRPETPRIRTLEDEIARVVRARAANPKWIAGVMRHGYKGAFEMAATVDYLFAFAATARAVKDHHFDLVFDAYLGDEAVRGFIAQHNAPALKEMAERFAEAVERGLWHPRSNAAPALLARLAGGERG
jgi:cobaltochelatase CobN